MPENTRRIISFADIVLDTGLRTATRGGEPLALGKLTFDVLLTLAQAAPSLVTQQELAEQVWQGRYVTHETITQRIKILRRDLGDDARNPRYIKVVRGQGWRLLPRVDALNESGHPESTRTSPRRFSRRNFAYGTGAFALSAGAIGLWPLMRPGTPRNSYAIALQRPLTSGPEMAIDPALSPDAQWLAYSRGPLGATSIFVRSLEGAEEWNLTSGMPGEHRWPRWSPDSRSIVFRSAIDPDTHQLRTIDFRGGEYHEIAGDRHLNGHDWSPVSDEIVYAKATANEIWVYSAARAEERQIATIPSPHAPAWSPDGKQILVASGNYFGIFGLVQFMNVAPSSIWLLSAETGEAQQVLSGERINDSPRWDPEGTGLFFVSDRDGRRAVHHARINRAGTGATHTKRLGGQDALSIDVARDGSSLCYAECTIETNIWRLPIPHDGPVTASRRDMTELTRGPQQIEGFEVSRDGAWLVYNSDRSGNQDIYLAALDGSGDERALTTDAATDSMPSLSPDHREVAFQSARENGIRNLYVYSLDTDSVSLALKSQNQDYCPQWGPDGNSLYFFSFDTESWQVWKIIRADRNGAWSEPIQISHGRATFTRVSPRVGGPVVYIGTEDGIGTGLIGAWENHEKRLLFPTEPNPWAYAAFAPDGAVVYVKYHEKVGRAPAMRILAIDIESGHTAELIRMERPSVGDYDPIYFSADEQYFYVSLNRRNGVIRWAGLEA